MACTVQSQYSRLFRHLSQLHVTGSAACVRLKHGRVSWVTPTTGSYAHGVSAVPLLNLTVGQALRQAVEAVPDKTAFIFPQQQISRTYEQLLLDVERLASGLLATGVKPGDRVGIWAPNNYEWILTQYATALAGIILVNINPAYQIGELDYCLKKVGIHTVIASSSFKTSDYYKMFTAICPQLAENNMGYIHDERFPTLKQIFMIGDEQKPGVSRFADLFAAGDSASDKQLAEVEAVIQTDEPVNIQFTSGTTGSPKGATLSHHNIVNNCYFLGRRLLYHMEPSVLCCPPPLYHCLGCVLVSLCSVVHKQTAVFPSAGFDPLATLQAIHDHRCTSLYGTPTMFVDMLNHPQFKEFDLNSLVTGFMAGAPCPFEVCKRVVEDMTCTEFTVGYGTTENSPVTFQAYRDDPVEKRIGSVGFIHDHTEAKIVDSNNQIVPIGERGELLIRGYSVMLGYWDEEKKTDEVIQKDRWYRTGDLAVMESDQSLQIVGRLKDMVIRGGENIYPVEIEQLYHTHPDIADIYIVGVPDERLGEELCAWVRLYDGVEVTPQQLKDYAKGKIAHFKIPKYFVFAGSFPMTVTGKVQKYKLRDASLKKLQSASG